jgi:hypothetical protein
MNDDDIALPIECGRYLISGAASPLTGRTMSARFDPWSEPEFEACLPEIVSSRVYATQRVNIEHIRGDALIEQVVNRMERRELRRVDIARPQKKS